jgi:hypothetical protein
MADTEVVKTPGKIVSAGRPTAADFRANTEGFQAAENNTETQDPPVGEGAKPELNEDGTPKVAAKAAPDAAKTGLTEDQLKEYFKSQGIDYEGVEKLKAKLAPQVQLTDEQKKQAELELEKKLFDLHTKRGGNLEQYAAFKAVAQSDVKTLGIDKIKRDLVADGFTADQADGIIKKMHFEVSDEDLAAIEDESERKLIEKERAFGLKKLTARGGFIQNTAKSYLDSLTKELQDLDAEKVKMELHTSKVEDAIKNFQRKQTLQLGKVDDQEIAPVDYDVPDEVLTEVKEILSDRAALESKLYNKEGDLNLEFLIPHLINSVSRDKAVRHAYITSADRQVAIFEKVFPSKSAPALGSNNNNKPAPTPGKIVGAGKAQPFRPNFKQ